MHMKIFEKTINICLLAAAFIKTCLNKDILLLYYILCVYKPRLQKSVNKKEKTSTCDVLKLLVFCDLPRFILRSIDVTIPGTKYLFPISSGQFGIALE